MKALHYVATFAVTVSAAVVLGDVVGAQNTNPSVNLRRVNSLFGPVWPGDFNNDGITDLAASDAPVATGTGRVVIALGNGDGTFNTLLYNQFVGYVLGATDFNKDGNEDVLAVSSFADGGTLVVLPGNGYSLGAAKTIATLDQVTFALIADFDGDGNKDIAVATQPQTLTIYPGNGDLTFGTPVQLTTGLWPHGGIVADFNNDGKKDIAVANRYGFSATIFMNQGSLAFTPSDIALDMAATDATAADVNGDGNVDLIVSMAKENLNLVPHFTEGHVYVLNGKGDGTFDAPVKYDVARGAFQVVVGEFTRDGITDIATANQSSLVFDDCGTSWKTWDSVSILPGNGNGTFAAASSFSVGNQMHPEDDRFKNAVMSLNTADVTSDGRTDLIVGSNTNAGVASPAVIFVNTAPDANWPPTVSAGPDETFSTGEFFLRAAAGDVDQDMLTYQWTDSGGRTIPPIPMPCLTSVTPGVHVYTVTVNDGHGHQTTDSVTYTVGTTPAAPTVTVTAPTAGEVLTAGAPYVIKWTASSTATLTEFDVQFSADNGATFTAIAACTNLPGTASECTWPNPSPATTQGVVRVTATDNFGQHGSDDSGVFSIVTTPSVLPAGWSDQDIGAVGKAGSASYASGVFTVNGDGADIWGTADEFHYAYMTLTGQFEITTRVDSVQAVNAWTKAGPMIRETLTPGSRHVSLFATPGKGVAFQRRLTTSGTSLSTAGPPTTAPVWLKLARRATTIEAFYRKNVTDFWTLIGSADVTGWPSTLHFGMAVTSHVDGTLAAANFSEVTLLSLPQWTGLRIGTTTGTATWNGAIVKEYGEGADIWGTADAFFYLYVPMSGDGYIRARVRSVQNTSSWAKAGVMIREALTTTSKHIMTVVTPGKGIAVQYRAGTGATSSMAAQIAGTAPEWVQLVRAGDTFTAWSSNDGVTFTKLATVTIPMNANIFIGLPVTSHNTTTAAQAVFDDVQVIP